VNNYSNYFLKVTLSAFCGVSGDLGTYNRDSACNISKFFLLEPILAHFFKGKFERKLRGNHPPPKKMGKVGTFRG
jgi:hypothetical protein